MAIINLTPHVLNIRDAAGNVHDIPQFQTAEGLYVQARRSMTKVTVPVIIDGIEFNDTKTEFGEVELWLMESPNSKDPVQIVDSIPEMTPDNVIVVSRLTFDGLCGYHFNRAKWYATGELIRDADGKPAGCDGFSS